MKYVFTQSEVSNILVEHLIAEGVRLPGKVKLVTNWNINRFGKNVGDDGGEVVLEVINADD